MHIRIIRNPSQELMNSLVDLEDDILPPFYQRCAVVEFSDCAPCLVVLPRDGECMVDDKNAKYKGMPTAAAIKHNVQRVRPDEAIPPGHCVIITYRKQGKVLCGLMDPEFRLPQGSQLFQVASEGALNMINLVKSAAVS